jgi:hypothetical protein
MRKILFGLFLSGAAFTPMDVVAQVPPHYPGTICFTPTFWCWAPQAGPPGIACACPTPYGWIGGRLG